MIILQSLWFFLPILVANQCPGIAVWFNLPGANKPVSQRWFGKSKTVAAYYMAPIGAIVTIYAQQKMTGWCSLLGLFDYNRSDLWLVGLLFGLGAALGDHIKSFFKRRIGVNPGDKWWPFDQIDFAIGGLLMSMPVVGWIGWWRASIIIIFVLIIHPIGNTIGCRWGLRKVPW